nr:nucleotidyltransferase family protein [Variovorax boronicumulans]
MKAVVLAGGLGTRLRERVPDLPKPMAPIAGRPFLAYLLERLKASGVVDAVTLSVGYRADLIQSFFGKDFDGMPLDYAVEAEPLGTGGAIAHALHGAADVPTLVLNGDTLLDLELPALVDWYARAPEALAMVLRQVDDAGRYGAIRTEDGRVTAFLPRGPAAPGLINAGIYLLRPSLFTELGLDGRFSFESDLLQRHVDRLRPRAHVVDAYFIDIGVPDDYDRANRELPGLAARPPAASAPADRP